MFSKLFESISYPLIAFIFFIFIVFIYLINKRYNSYSNKAYRVLLIITFIASFAIFFFDLARAQVSIFKGLDNIFARIYTISFLLWASTYSYYLIITIMLKDVSLKKLRITKAIVYSITLILIIYSLLTKIEYDPIKTYSLTGDILIPLYIEFGIVFIIYLISIIPGYKKMTKAQFVMHIFVLIILITVILQKFLLDLDVNYFSYLACIIPIAIFFSSESSAYLQSIELEKSKNELEISNELQNQKIMSLSSELINPFANIIYSNELINENVLNEEQIKNEKIKIYNETKKIYDLITVTSQSESEVENND